jgi:hypothetical protein
LSILDCPFLIVHSWLSLLDCPFLLVHSWLPLRFSLTFISIIKMKYTKYYHITERRDLAP